MYRSSSIALCRCIPAALFLPFLFGGCRGDRGGEVTTVIDSAGVTIVTASGVDRPLGWTAEEVLRIPPAEEDSAGFFEASDMDVLPGNRIVVLDRQGKKLVLFDEDGHLLAQYGREGEGPGEFRYPLELAVTPGGGVTVFDLMNHRLERFDSTLTPRAPDPIQGIPYFGGHVAYAGPFLVLPTSGAADPSGNSDVLSAYSATDSVEIVRYRREPGRTIQLESCGMGFSGMPVIFAPSTRWEAGPSGEVVVAGTSRYEVDIYRQPTFVLERRIRRNVPVIEATQSMAKATVGDAMRVMTSAGERVCDADEVVEKRGFASEVPPLTRIALSPSGRIYLQRRASDERADLIDIFASDGGYTGTLSEGFPFPQAFLDEDRIMVREEDEMGLWSLVVYRIQR